MILNYKGYTAVVELSKDNAYEVLLRGHVIGIKDVITFYSNNVKDIEYEFQESVKEYLEFCKEQGDEPEKPDISNHLHSEFNAQIWTQEFIKKAKNDPYFCTDEGTMLSWFANAIMSGYDRGIEDGKNI